MTRPSRDEQGFALIAVIWFIALLALVGVIISGWMTRSLEFADRLQHRLTARATFISAENEITFRIESGFTSIRGLELPVGEERTKAAAKEAAFGYRFGGSNPYIALDNRPYRLGSTLVRLQDDRGLYSLTAPDRALLDGLLRHYGISYLDRGMLLDRLFDYMGQSVLHRLRGASAEDYQKAGRPPPRGAPLLTPWEAVRVLSWDNYAALWNSLAPLPDLTTVGNVAQLNPNTAPAAILATLPGVNTDAVQRILEYRKKHIIQYDADLDRAAGVHVPIDPTLLMFIPAAGLEVTIQLEGDPLTHRLRLTRTPNGKEPFRIGYAVDLPTKTAAQSGDTAEPLEIPTAN